VAAMKGRCFCGIADASSRFRICSSYESNNSVQQYVSSLSAENFVL